MWTGVEFWTAIDTLTFAAQRRRHPQRTEPKP